MEEEEEEAEEVEEDVGAALHVDELSEFENSLFNA